MSAGASGTGADSSGGLNNNVAPPGVSTGGPGTAAAGSSSSSHRHKYKNTGLDAQELRRRREEEGVQLRKIKREQQLFKRRNVFNDDSSIQVQPLRNHTMNGQLAYYDLYLKYTHFKK